MAKTYPLIQVTDTFQAWLNRTNALTNDLATVIVTTDGTAAGALTNGNVQLNGNQDLNTLSVGVGIKGGTNTTTAPLNILSDAILNQDLTVAGDTFINGPTFNVSAATPAAFLADVEIYGTNLDVTALSTFTQPIVADITGNAVTATNTLALATPRSIALAGDVSGSVMFDGSADVTITTAIDETTIDPTLILNQILQVDGAGSTLDADTVDGVQAASFVRNDSNQSIDGTLTVKTSATITDGTSTWRMSMSGDGLSIAFNGTRLFKLDPLGNLVVKGDITAFGAV